MLKEEKETEWNGVEWGGSGGNNKVEKATKVEKWKSIKLPESIWHLVKVSAAKNRRKLYEEVADKF